jgi:integrase
VRILLRGGSSARALVEFLILTAARTGEVIGSRWEEFDLDHGIWTIPATRMKAGPEHRVPMSGAGAFEIIRGLRKTAVSDFVFTGCKPSKPLSNMAMLRLPERMGRANLTAHGFRSTFRDCAAEQTDYPREVAEMALAHTVGDKVEAAYRRGDLFQKRRDMLAEWARHCVPTTATSKGA